MIPLFLGLTTANLVGLLAAAVMGYVSVGRPEYRGHHLLVGVLAAILCVGVHCVVFTYFVATAKWIRHAVAVKGLDPGLALPTRSFKAMAFPAALGSMTLVFVAACLGAAHDALHVDPTWHHVLALTSVAANLAGAAVEYHAIYRNGALIDEILARIGVQEPGT
jgi:hypothetical protein